MANTVAHSLIFVLIFFALCNARENQEFLKCVSETSEGKIDRYVHPTKSPMYAKFFKYAQKNGRWLNSTSARPLFLVAPFTEAQVQSIISCSKKLGLQIRVKSGGHDYEGLSFRCETPFVMIDLNNLNSIDIDVKDETAWIQAGATLGELYYAISQKSKTHAFAGGLYPTVGSGGHISGGGFGTLLRKFGLAADNVVDARIANADGKILDRESMGEDLFWALRGGGGASFGVILAWKIKLSQIPEEVTSFTVRRRLNAESIQLLQRWEEIGHQLPEDLFLRILIQKVKQNVTGEEKIVQISFQGLFLGTADDLATLLNQNFPEFNLEENDCFQDPVNDPNCKEKPCIKKECYQVSWIQSVLYFAGKKPTISLEYLATKNFSTPPSYYKAKSDFVRTPIPAAGFEMIHKLFLEEETPMMILDPFGGKMSQFSESDAPFPYREGIIFNIQYLVNWKGDQEKSEVNKHLDWIKKLYENMQAFVSSSPRGAYINYKDLDLGANNEAYHYAKAKSWGEKYFNRNFERLAKVKSKVDPSNFFRNEQSIPLLQECPTVSNFSRRFCQFRP